MTRLHCVFRNCNCSRFIGSNLCLHCNHAECWHQFQNAFLSPRCFARTPHYRFSRILPSVPPLPEVIAEFCPTVIGLPV